MSEDRPKYTIVEYIGKGGMGQVYRGVSHGVNGFRRDVAIKQLRSSRATDYDAHRKFLREARISAALNHPNIVPVFDFVKDNDGNLCLIMAFVDGVDLHDVMEAGLLPIPVVVYIIDSVLQGLAHAHDRGIIHRDVTPGNIMISRDGAVHLTDFGLAHDLTDRRIPSFGGTPGFMSPESLQEHTQDARSDLFSVGVILYELLTGQKPFPGAHRVERISNTLCNTPAPPIALRPELPEALSDITMRLLAREAGERFKSAVEVRAALPPSRHGSEDLAAIVNQLAQARRPSSGPSSEEQCTTEPFRRRIGDTIWGEANDGHTVLAPVPTSLPIPTPILTDPEIIIPLLDSAAMSGRPSRRTVRASEQPRPALDSLPRAKPALDSLPRANQLEDAAQAERVPSPPRPARETRPGRKVALALAAVAALIVCGVLGERALRHDRALDQITAPSAPPDQADEPARSDAPQAPENARKGKSDQVTRAKRPLEPLDKAQTAEDPSTARPRSRPTAQRTRAPAARTAALEDQDPATSDKRRADRPDTGNGVTEARSWADGMDDPSAVNPVERFTVSTGAPLAGELIMEDAP
jgi:serine/threonine protein kinase